MSKVCTSQLNYFFVKAIRRTQDRFGEIEQVIREKGFTEPEDYCIFLYENKHVNSYIRLGSSK
jgi:hypothetical protein